MNTKLKLTIAAALTLFGATPGQATSPVPPYIPSEPYAYRCNVTVESGFYQRDSQEPSKRWRSRATVEIAKGKFFVDAADVKWTHTVSESMQYMMGPEQPISDNPHVKDTYVGIQFDYPQDGVVAANLTAGFSSKAGDTTDSTRTVSKGRFTDKHLSARAERSQWTESTGISRDKEIIAECQRIR